MATQVHFNQNSYSRMLKHQFVSQIETCVKVTLTVEEMTTINESGALDINRPVVKSHIKKLRKDIGNGKWVVNSGNVIKFDHNGYLIDGRHRFLAHLQEGVSFTTYVITGLDPQAILVTDVGKARKTPDNTVLKVHIENGTVPQKAEFDMARKRASVAKEIYRHNTGGYPTPQEIRDTEVSFANEITIAITPVDNTNMERPGVLAAIADYARRNPKKAVEFREAVGGDGLDLPNGGPVTRLQKYLSISSIGGSQMKEDYFRTVCAIHAFHQNTPFKNLVEKKEWDF